MPTTENKILSEWKKWATRPAGKRIFSALLGRMIPYTGSIKAYVMSLKPGYCQVILKDRKSVRNHLNSVHAIALMNLAELATGLAMNSALHSNMRGIVTRLSMDYLKKARGTLTAECQCDIPRRNEEAEYILEGIIRDEVGDIVAVGIATWKVGPRPDQ